MRDNSGRKIEIYSPGEKIWIAIFFGVLALIFFLG